MLLGIVTALVLLELVIVGDGEIPPILWPLALVYALYATATILVFVALVARLRGRALRPLPLLPPRWNTHPRAYVGLGVVVGLLTLLREGALLPTLVWNYDVYQAEHRTNTSRDSGGNAATLGEGPGDVMAGRPVHCTLGCAGPGTTCEAILEQIRCDDDSAGASEGSVIVAGTITAEDPGCYFPLYKSSHTDFHAQLSLDLATGRTTKNIGATIQGTLDQEATGPMSCLSYRRLAAQKIAAEIAAALRATLDAN